MEKFARQYPKLAKMKCTGDSEFLSIDCPTALARFFAYCNGRSTDTRIFLRGCTENYDPAYPSLFRQSKGGNLSQEEQSRRWRAYQYVLHNLRNLKGRRWRRENLGAVLQHYGMRTPWLDVVQNLYSAIWFASHELQGSGPVGKVRPTTRDYCWISFYRRKARATKKRLCVKDLSAQHSSTHLRLHVQHGVSLAMQRDDAKNPYSRQDFNAFRIAQVRIPNSTQWKLSGCMASTAFMFPSDDLDDSLERLRATEVQDILEKACAKCGICPGTLGKISRYC